MMGPLQRSWLRLFLVQASWNYDRMVGAGVAYAMDPLLATLPGGRGGQRYRGAMHRATAYFNAHPYLAGMAVGAEARAEHDGVSAEEVERLRRALVAPLGSLGDQLVWAGALPAAIGLGLIAAVLVSPLVGVAAFLVLYNAVHVYARTWALGAGWRLGTDVARSIGGDGVRRALAWATPISALAVGFALPVTARWLTQAFDGEARLGVTAVAAVAIVLNRWLLPTVGGLRLGLIVALLAGVVGWLWR